MREDRKGATASRTAREREEEGGEGSWGGRGRDGQTITARPLHELLENPRHSEGGDGAHTQHLDHARKVILDSLAPPQRCDFDYPMRRPASVVVIVEVAVAAMSTCAKVSSNQSYLQLPIFNKSSVSTYSLTWTLGPRTPNPMTFF